jgi:hypothetical protein
MALSDYDCLAVNERGEPVSGGAIKSPLGVCVEIYKTWLYIRDEKAWNGGSFTKPTVMQIEQGALCYKDLRVRAKRGPQDGVYAVAWWYGVGWKEVFGMAGCGVYGYEAEGEFVGVLPESRGYLQEMLRGESDESNFDVPAAFASLDLSQAKRANQGDAYFAKALCGCDGLLPATPIGEAQPPLLQALIKKLSEP